MNETWTLDERFRMVRDTLVSFTADWPPLPPGFRRAEVHCVPGYGFRIRDVEQSVGLG